MKDTTTHRPDVDDDVIGNIGYVPPHLLTEHVDVVVVGIRTIKFRMYGRTKLVFDLRIIAPQAHAGERLPMYVRVERDWKTLPIASKLFRIACVATGRVIRDTKVRKSWFLGQAFRGQVRQVGKPPATYSVVETLFERLTGPKDL